jgi:uncharacterized cupredoxin-like copper-binding protein
MRLYPTTLLMLVLLAPPAALGDETHAHGAAGLAATDAGEAGRADAVRRTVRVGMHDAMRFSPGVLSVRRGDTVRLLVRNHGQIMHEIVLGTPAEIEQHRLAMRRDPAMAHGAPYMAHVAPGAQAQMLWRFSRAGTVHYACLLPGHYEAGMTGTIEVR